MQSSSVSSPKSCPKAIIALGNNRLAIWDLEKKEELSQLVGHTDSVSAVAVTPCGNKAISGSRDKTLIIWDLQTNQPINHLGNHSRRRTPNRFAGHGGWVNSVAISPDGTTCASGSNDRTIILWSLASESNVTIPAAHDDWVNVVAFSPDSQILASGSSDETIKFWNPNNGTELACYRGHYSCVKAIVFAGEFIVSGSADNTIRVWESSGQRRQVKAVRNHDDDVSCLAISPDLSWIASGSYDGTIKVWSFPSFKLLSMLDARSPVESLALNGNDVISAHEDGNIRKWDFRQGFVQIFGYHKTWAGAIAVIS